MERRQFLKNIAIITAGLSAGVAVSLDILKKSNAIGEIIAPNVFNIPSPILGYIAGGFTVNKMGSMDINAISDLDGEKNFSDGKNYGYWAGGVNLTQ